MIKRASIVVIISAALILPTLSYAATQRWVLTDTAINPTGAPIITSIREMDRVGSPGYDGGKGRDIVIDGHSSASWVANEPAIIDTGFPGTSKWTGQLVRATTHGKIAGAVDIGVWNGSTFSWAPGGAADFSNGSDISSFAFSSHIDIPQGQFLAFRYSNLSRNPVVLTTTAKSYLNSPVSDPGYPVPDTEAWTLFAVGLGGIGLAVHIYNKLKKGHQRR